MCKYVPPPFPFPPPPSLPFILMNEGCGRKCAKVTCVEQECRLFDKDKKERINTEIVSSKEFNFIGKSTVCISILNQRLINISKSAVLGKSISKIACVCGVAATFAGALFAYMQLFFLLLFLLFSPSLSPPRGQAQDAPLPFLPSFSPFPFFFED